MVIILSIMVAMAILVISVNMRFETGQHFAELLAFQSRGNPASTGGSLQPMSVVVVGGCVGM
jgi:hypothetical protein